MSTLCVRLKSCNAITKGGLPIVYYDGLYGDEKPSATISESGLQAEDSEYMVLISVDPYHLIPVGEPDPEEVPLHHPVSYTHLLRTCMQGGTTHDGDKELINSLRYGLLSREIGRAHV